MQQYPAEIKRIKMCTVGSHCDERIDHGQIIGYLTQGYEPFDAGHGIERYDHRHDDSQIEGARFMSTVKKEGRHHKDRIDP